MSRLAAVIVALPLVTVVGLAVRPHAESGTREASVQVPKQEKAVQTHPWCATGANSNTATLLLTPDSLGPVTPSLTKALLDVVCPGLRDTVWQGAEGIPQQATVLRLAGRTVGLVEWAGPELRLARVLIESPLVRTVDSLGVGSRVRDLRKRLGKLSAGYDDAGVYVWSTDQPNLSYLLRLRVTSLLSVPDSIAEHPEVVPDSARVRKVVMVGRR